MKTHVLVLAVSTFRWDGMKKTVYEYVDKSLPEGEQVYTCEGYYQLEPIPLFITEKLGETITHVVLLETREIWSSEHSKTVNRTPDGKDREWTGTPAQWYRKWLRRQLGNDLEIINVRVYQFNPAGALEKTLTCLRDLHEKANGDSWRLWFDTHGAFRDIALALVSAIRMFAVDETQPVQTNGVFSILYDENRKAHSAIYDMTAFYFTESANALKHYLNYGQYLLLKFNPYEGDEPYAFISYRHDDRFLTSVRNIFTKFNEFEIRYWFDDGIHAFQNWRETLVKRNENASLFIGLLTDSYFQSKECWKELIRAISAAKTGKSQIRFMLLEKGMRLPDTCPYDEVRALQEELGVTDADVRYYFDQDSMQWIKWYCFMPTSRRKEINEDRIPDDEFLKRDFGCLGQLLENRAAR